MERQRTFYEFFAGGGMVSTALRPRSWRCLFANDFDHKKGEAYSSNFGRQNLLVGDIATLSTSDLPGRADLAWASFPCQDLSLAGGGAGLKGDRSGTFWPFWALMNGLIAEDRAPSIIALENVMGTLSSHSGKDFEAICEAIFQSGYRAGAVIIDAAHFLPQSRSRVFIVAIKPELLTANLSTAGAGPNALWHPRPIRTAFNRLPGHLQRNWIWWRLPAPDMGVCSLTEVLEEAPTDVRWHSDEETSTLLSLMDTNNLEKVRQAQRSGTLKVGTIYKRTRGKALNKSQRAEVRFDDLAGCLRTPSGGSSRQLIIVVDGHKIRTRLVSARETARLMGLPDSYILPSSYNEAYHLTGDGVAVPVVSHLAFSLFEPISDIATLKALVTA